MICSSRFYALVSVSGAAEIQDVSQHDSHLEALVLQHSFNGCILARGRQFCLENHAEAAIAHNLALSVLHLSRLAGQAILHLLANNLCARGQRESRLA